MQRSILTLTTDFGLSDAYVAQMKGVILGINPEVELVDVTHFVPAQNVLRAAVLLDEAVDAFPAGTIHVAVVDPGVGSERAIVAVEMGAWRFVGPDNGLFSAVARRFPPTRIVEITERQFWREPVSHTFHGRDIMAPVAAHWSLGTEMTRFGPSIDGPLVELSEPIPQHDADSLAGEVLWADAFGNLITNIPADLLPAEQRGQLTVEIGERLLTGICTHYSQEPAGGVLALIGSSGRLEIAVNAGSAARMLQLGAGAPVRVSGFSTAEQMGEQT